MMKSSLLLILLLLAATVAVSAQTPASPAREAASSQKTTAAKVKLNGEEVGTTLDSAALVKRLTGIFDRREGKFSNGTVFIRAERSVRFGEVARVIEAVGANRAIPYLAIESDSASAGKAGADPLLVGYDLLESGEIYRKPFPRSMMLVITIGNPGSDKGELISGGINLNLTGFTLRYSARQTVPKEFVTVEAFRDNEYSLDGKIVPLSSLTGELQSRLSKNEDKRVMILTRSDSDLSWGSFMDSADAARKAGAGMVQYLMLTP
jgi:biopolymer transport protein ExbD